MADRGPSSSGNYIGVLTPAPTGSFWGLIRSAPRGRYSRWASRGGPRKAVVGGATQRF